MAECLLRTSVEVLPAAPTTPFVRSSFPDDHTFDARAHVNPLFPSSTYPVDLGGTRAGLNACWLGGVFIGQQSRSLTWEEVKAIGGASVRFIQRGDAIIDGLQSDNHHDGLYLRSPAPGDGSVGDGWVIRNSYMTYTRDDCLENDHLLTGTISDVLWDGCFVGISAQDVHGITTDQSSERIVLQNALIRLQQMPSSSTARGVDHGDLFKWSSTAPRVTIRDSVFLVEHWGAGEWPPGTVIENSTVVWIGEGTLSLDPMPGLTITTDQTVWDKARQDWLDRHGCTSFGSCRRLTDPVAPSP